LSSGKPAYPALEDWIEIFRHSIGSFRRTAEADPSLPEPERQRRAAQFAAAYLAVVNETERQALAASSKGSTSGDAAPAAAMGCLELCRLRCVGMPAHCSMGVSIVWLPMLSALLTQHMSKNANAHCREDALIAAGFTDIFLPIKAAENASALALLPDICRELDEHEEQVGRTGAANGVGGAGCKCRLAVPGFEAIETTAHVCGAAGGSREILLDGDHPNPCLLLLLLLLPPAARPLGRRAARRVQRQHF
jgi:hypothetical protein